MRLKRAMVVALAAGALALAVVPAPAQSAEDTMDTPLQSIEALTEIWNKSSKPEIPVHKAVREIMPRRMRVAR
jgi:hypothetical protein